MLADCRSFRQLLRHAQIVWEVGAGACEVRHKRFCTLATRECPPPHTKNDSMGENSVSLTDLSFLKEIQTFHSSPVDMMVCNDRNMRVLLAKLIGAYWENILYKRL